MTPFAPDFQFGGFQRIASAGDQTGARLLVVAGGRLGVGSTTAALHVAHELAQDAQRIVLVDANLPRPAVAKRCGLSASMTIADVLAGRKTIHEALARGPAGMQVLAASALADTNSQPDERAINRLLKQLASLSPHADWLIVDSGHTLSDLAAKLWSAAGQLLLVTTPDAVAVMDSYAVVKTMHARGALRQPPALLVNHADSEPVAADVYRRIDQSCRRFLGLSLGYGGVLPRDSSADGQVLDPAGPLAASIAKLCKHLSEEPPKAANPLLAA